MFARRSTPGLHLKLFQPTATRSGNASSTAGDGRWQCLQSQLDRRTACRSPGSTAAAASHQDLRRQSVRSPNHHDRGSGLGAVLLIAGIVYKLIAGSDEGKPESEPAAAAAKTGI